MSILDDLTFEQIREHISIFKGIYYKAIKARDENKLMFGNKYVVSDSEALSIAIKYAEMFGSANLPIWDDSVPLYILENEIEAVADSGDVYMGDGSKVDGDLLYVKNFFMLKIDQKSEDSIINGQGFEWPVSSGKYFSLTYAAQSKWTGLYSARSMISYPYKVPTKNDTELFSILDSSEVESMYQEAVSTITSILDEANVAKQLVIDADNVNDVKSGANTYLQE